VGRTREVGRALRTPPTWITGAGVSGFDPGATCALAGGEAVECGRTINSASNRASMLRYRAATVNTKSVTGAPALSRSSFTATQLAFSLLHCAAWGAREPKSSQTAVYRACVVTSHLNRCLGAGAGLRDAAVFDWRKVFGARKVFRWLCCALEGSGGPARTRHANAMGVQRSSSAVAVTSAPYSSSSSTPPSQQVTAAADNSGTPQSHCSSFVTTPSFSSQLFACGQHRSVAPRRGDVSDARVCVVTDGGLGGRLAG